MSFAAARGRAHPRLIWLVPCVLAVLTWPGGSDLPISGLDASWGGALHMAAVEHLAWGRDISFTYGPLGFLAIPVLWEEPTGVLAILFTGVTQVAACAVLFAVARTRVGTPAAIALTYAVTLLLGIQGLLLIVFTGAQLAVTGRLTRPPAPIAAGIGGVLGAVDLLVKPPQGGAILLLLIVAVCLLPEARLRAFLAAAAAFVVSFLALWIVARQPLGAIPAYVTMVREQSSGYSAAMASETPGHGWEYPLAALLVVLGSVAFVLGSHHLAGRARAGSLALWVVLCFFLFKVGFVRHDVHSVQFFSGLGAALLVVAWGAWVRRLQTLMTLGGLGLALGAGVLPVASSISPVTRARQTWAAARDVVSAGTRDRRVAQARATMRAGYAVPARALGAVTGRSVHVGPSETGVAWAYEVRWDPLPVFQTYTAYTPQLDGLNARFLRSARAPQRLLLDDAAGIDGRWLGFDEPRSNLAMLCNYRPVVDERSWLVLARGRPRCGRPAPAGDTRVRWGEDVAVPAPASPDAIVLMSVTGVGISGLAEGLRDIAYKPAYRWIDLDGRTYRFVAGSGEGTPLIVRAGATADLPGDFALAPGARELRFRRAGHEPSGTLRIHFAQMRVHSP